MKIFIMIVLVVIVILSVIYILGRNIDDGNNNDYGIDDSGYREYVYKAVQRDFKPYLQQILQDIDAINSLRNTYNTELNQATYNAMVEIYNKANDVEAKIKSYWSSNQFSKDFSFYIGLHYASHLLGNAIKQEQQVIKNTFVQCKTVQKQWGNKIDDLKYKQERVSGRTKSEISQEIARCCKAHKQVSNLASQIGAVNTKYNQRVTQQHIETGKRRDFIAENFGERGRRWKERMRTRALQRK